jgi:hypothetical protein
VTIKKHDSVPDLTGAKQRSLLFCPYTFTKHTLAMGDTSGKQHAASTHTWTARSGMVLCIEY